MKRKIGFVFGVACSCILLLAAALPGIFSLVNATTGYQVNGAAGTSGQALCSDGTYFDTPCTPPGTGITALTGPVTASGSGSVASSITATGVTAGSYVGTNLTVNAAGQITSASNGFSSGSNSNGYWSKDPSGLIRQFGTITVVGAGNPAPYATFTFPTAFATTNYSITGNGNGLAIGGVLSGAGDIPIVAFDSFSTSGARWRLDTNNGVNFGTVNFQWIAIGY